MPDADWNHRERRPTHPAVRIGLRVILVVWVGVMIALELQRPKDPSPPPSKTEPGTNAPAGPPGNHQIKATLPVGFDQLGAYEIRMPELVETKEGLLVHAAGSISNQIPANIRNLDGRLVTVAGFMQPISLKKGKVSEFLLFRDLDTCCFGGTPQLNHWIGVVLTNGTTPAKLGRPVTVEGRLYVREIRTDGVLVGVYRLEASRVTDADLPTG